MNNCPKCKTSKVVSIVYGMPDYSLAEDEMKGKVILGGCVIHEDAPEYHCKECQHEWSDK